MSYEPKNCPFCGSVAESRVHDVLGRQARCLSMNCDGRITWIHIDVWNRRAPSPAMKALVEACRRWLSADSWTDHEIAEALAAVEKEIQ